MTTLLLLMMFAGQGATEYWTGEIRGFAEQSPCYVSSREGYCFTSYDAALRSLATLPERRESRQYHRITAAHVRTTSWTHVEVVGRVDNDPRKEGDGDLHIVICDRTGCVLGERPPSTCGAFVIPKKGDRVRAWGVSRVEKRGGHPNKGEIHPLEGLEILR